MRSKPVLKYLLLPSIFLLIICFLVLKYIPLTKTGFIEQWLKSYPRQNLSITAQDSFYQKLSDAAIERSKHTVRYVPDYVIISYPMGDVPSSTGVCTDEIIRAYRTLGIDLQVEVHEDMKKHFVQYPKIWGRLRPDSNIDHRRVPNLMTFFKRNGIALPITKKAEDYSPGDIVSWDLGGGLTHIGIVVNERGKEGKRFKIMHNIGNGPKLDDRLFAWKIIGHFRYNGRKINN
ncbi:MAG: DUF1287 domain-containing protein [Nitrospirota bacterium]